MNLERTAMLAALNTVKPALASKPLVEALTHVWFDGESMMAYDDMLGIQAPFASPFEGGIHGGLLLGFLGNSRVKELSLEPMKAEGKQLLKAGRARLELAVLSPEKSVWQFPAPKPKAGFALSAAFLEALRAVLISVGNDTSLPEKQGVTMIFDGAALSMFTTDSRSIGHAEVEMGKSGKGSCILPTAFCEQLLRLGGEGTVLEIRDDCAIASTKSGVLLYARLVHADQPRDFFEILEREGVADPEKIEGLFEIPGRLSLALERAIVLLDGAADGRFEIKLGGGKLVIEASAPGRGDLKDDSVDAPKGGPDMSCSIDPELIKRAIPICTHMAFGNCLYMDDGAGFSYLAAYRGK